MKKYLLGISITLLMICQASSVKAVTLKCQYVNTGSQPTGITTDNQGNVYAILSQASMLVKLGDGCAVETSYGLPGDDPMDVAFDGTNLWVTLYTGNAVEKINASTGNGTVYPVGGTNPRGVVFDGTYIWVANYGSNTVTKMLPSNGAILNTVPVGSGPYFLAVNPVNQTTIWVANRDSANVTVLNQSGVAITTLATGSEPQFIAWDGGNNMWVSCYSSQLVEQFTFTGLVWTLASSYAITGHGQPTGISSGGGALWGVTHGGAVFEIILGAVHYSFPLGDNNFDAVYDPVSRVLWVTDLDQGKVFEVN